MTRPASCLPDVVTAEITGDEPFDSVGIMMQATSGSAESAQVFDSASGIDMPTAPIQPGRTLEYSVAFGVNEGEPFDLTISDMLNFMGDDVTLSTDLR